MRIWGVLLGLLCLPVMTSGAEYSLPRNNDDIIGSLYVVTIKKGDSLDTIRMTNEISYDELLRANPRINFYKLKVGQQVIVPKEFILPKVRDGIVINIPELRMYYFDPDGRKVHTFIVGLGRANWRTPVGSTKVVNKRANPSWTVPESIRNYTYNKTGEILPRVVAPGPKNPLGKYALYLNMGAYHIHGTNAPSSVGTFISSGCVRMLQDPIEFLYNTVQLGTTVRLVHYPYKAGWLNNKLYLESHKPIDSYANKGSSSLSESDVRQVIQESINKRSAQVMVDWSLVFKNTKECLGIPEAVGY